MSMLPVFLRFLLLALFTAGYSVNLDFQASIDRNQLAIDEDVTVTFQISGDNIKDNLPFPEPQPSNDFKLLNKNNYQSSSQNISIVNGRMTRSTIKTFTFQFTFKPLKTGQLQIPGFKFQYQDFQRELGPTNVMVGKEAPESRDVDLSLRFSKNSMYINEQALLTVTIRQKENSAVQNINAPDIEKELKKYFWIKPMAEGWPGRRENIGNEMCRVFTRSFIVFPILDGQVRIPSIPLQYTVAERQTRRRSNDPFSDPFFDGFMDNVSTRAKTKYSAPVTVEVRSVPDKGRPQDYNGAVGEFSMSGSVDKREVKAGDALNLKLTVTGRGNEKSIGALHFKNAEKFEVFDPEIQSAADIKNNQLFVTKTFRFVLIPQIEGNQTLGPVSLYFYNPAKGAYDSAQYSIEINVLKGKMAQSAQGRYLSKEEVRLVGKDIRYIKTDSNNLRNQARRFYKSPLFVFLIILPFLYTAAFLLFRRHTERLKTDVEYARQKKAKKQAAKWLSQAEQGLNKGSSAEFHTALHRSLTGFIADKLNIPSAALTAADASTHLKKKLPQSDVLIKEISDLLADCEMHRFASVSDTPESRTQKFGKAEEMLTRLSKELK